MVDLQPLGYLETTLAQRVARLVWRLRRAANYERDCAAVSLGNIEDDLGRRGSSYWKPGDPSPLDQATELFLFTDL